MQSSIITNVNILKRKLNPHAEKTAEEERKVRRVTESKRRSAIELHQRLIVKAEEVIKLLTKRGLSLDDLRKNDAGKLIQLSDLERMPNLYQDTITNHYYGLLMINYLILLPIPLFKALLMKCKTT